jgi:hypothetical protein
MQGAKILFTLKHVFSEGLDVHCNIKNSAFFCIIPLVPRGKSHDNLEFDREVSKIDQ